MEATTTEVSFTTSNSFETTTVSEESSGISFYKNFLHIFKIIFNLECRDPMGISDHQLIGTQISVSSVLDGDVDEFGSDRARLNGFSAWRPVGTRAEYLIVLIN